MISGTDLLFIAAIDFCRPFVVVRNIHRCLSNDRKWACNEISRDPMRKIDKHAPRTDKPKALKLTLFTLLICCSRKKGFRHLFTFAIKALTYTYVPAGPAHFMHSASIV